MLSATCVDREEQVGPRDDLFYLQEALRRILYVDKVERLEEFLYLFCLKKKKNRDFVISVLGSFFFNTTLIKRKVYRTRSLQFFSPSLPL